MDSVLTYQQGNKWQRNRYSFMSDYNRQMGIKEFGPAPGKEQPYYHILKPKDSLHNFLGESAILEAVKKRFGHHKAGDIARVMTNTVASQPCCFNLFVPLQRYPDIASNLFSILLNKKVHVSDIVIEFTPETKGESGDESLGDQGPNRGTDADVAVFYKTGKQKGVVLFEFKYIESEFSQCGSYKNDRKNKFRSICDNQVYYKTLIEPNLEKKSGRFNCGYLKYFNWRLTGKSEVFDNNAVLNSSGCPFRYSGQQLWRNLLLAENIARARKLDEFSFWVLSPAENTFLWEENGKNVEAELRNVLTPDGNRIFRRLELDKDFFQVLKPFINDDWISWSTKFKERYLTGTKF